MLWWLLLNFDDITRKNALSLSRLYAAMSEARPMYTQTYNSRQIWEGMCRERQAQGAINWRGVPPFRAESNAPRYLSATTAAGILQAHGILATTKEHPSRTRDDRGLQWKEHPGE